MRPPGRRIPGTRPGLPLTKLSSMGEEMVYRASLTAPVFGLRREIDRLFEDVFNAESGDRHRPEWAPVADVHEDAHALTLNFELPGINASDVEITTENGVLTVRGEKHDTREENDPSSRYHVVERTYGSFARSFQLPKGIDEGKIEARFDRGVLSVRVPKGAVPEARRITINSSDVTPSTSEAKVTK